MSLNVTKQDFVSLMIIEETDMLIKIVKILISSGNINAKRYPPKYAQTMQSIEVVGSISRALRK